MDSEGDSDFDITDSMDSFTDSHYFPLATNEVDDSISSSSYFGSSFDPLSHTQNSILDPASGTIDEFEAFADNALGNFQTDNENIPNPRSPSFTFLPDNLPIEPLTPSSDSLKRKKDQNVIVKPLQSHNSKVESPIQPSPSKGVSIFHKIDSPSQRNSSTPINQENPTKNFTCKFVSNVLNLNERARVQRTPLQDIRNTPNNLVFSQFREEDYSPQSPYDGNSSPNQMLEETTQKKTRGRGVRGSYKCAKCGEPKKGHNCSEKAALFVNPFKEDVIDVENPYLSEEYRTNVSVGERPKKTVKRVL